MFDYYAVANKWAIGVSRLRSTMFLRPLTSKLETRQWKRIEMRPKSVFVIQKHIRTHTQLDSNTSACATKAKNSFAAAHPYHLACACECVSQSNKPARNSPKLKMKKPKLNRSHNKIIPGRSSHFTIEFLRFYRSLSLFLSFVWPVSIQLKRNVYRQTKQTKRARAQTLASCLSTWKVLHDETNGRTNEFVFV